MRLASRRAAEFLAAWKVSPARALVVAFGASAVAEWLGARGLYGRAWEEAMEAFDAEIRK